MKIFHSVVVTVFASEKEKKERLEGLIKLFPFKVLVEEERAVDLDGQPLHIMRVRLKKSSEIRQLFEFLYEKLSKGDKDLIDQQIETRVDEGCQFFLRFEANPWEYDNVLELTEGGQCYHLRALIAAYPAIRESALTTVRKYLAALRAEPSGTAL